jgi:hypothetical protein
MDIQIPIIMDGAMALHMPGAMATHTTVDMALHTPGVMATQTTTAGAGVITDTMEMEMETDMPGITEVDLIMAIAQVVDQAILRMDPPTMELALDNTMITRFHLLLQGFRLRTITPEEQIQINRTDKSIPEKKMVHYFKQSILQGTAD